MPPDISTGMLIFLPACHVEITFLFSCLNADTFCEKVAQSMRSTPVHQYITDDEVFDTDRIK